MKWGEERGLRVSTELPSGAPEQAGFPIATFHICPGGAAIKTSLPRGRLSLAGQAGFGRDFGPGLVHSRALPPLSDRPWPTLVPQKWASGGPPRGPGETFRRFPVYCELKGEGMRRRDPLLLLVENSKKCAFSIWGKRHCLLACSWNTRRRQENYLLSGPWKR